MPPRFFGDDEPGDSAPAKPATRRIALVIGNGNYRSSRLENPARDARMIGQVLDSLGFDTELVIDAGKAVLETAIVRLGERLENAGPEAVGFFYFAGHGIQHLGANYLVPVDAQIPDTRYLKSGAVLVDYLVEELARAHSLANVIVLDACRDSAVRDTGGGMTQGLASIRDLPDGTLVVFSTAAGQVAEDGSGDNSPYAKALIHHLSEPNRRLEEIFFSVSRDVAVATNNLQRPALFVQGAIAPVVLKPQEVESPPPAPVPPPPPPVEAEPSAPRSAEVLPPPEPASLKEIAGSLRPAPVTQPPPAQSLPPQSLTAQSLPPRPFAPVRPAPAVARSAMMPVAGVLIGAALIAAAVAGLFLRSRPAPAPSDPVPHAQPQPQPAYGQTDPAPSEPTPVQPRPLVQRVDLSNPAGWPVAAGTAVLWRVPPGEPCQEGWSRVLDGTYCVKSGGAALGAVWETGRLPSPLATAMTVKTVAKVDGRCPETAPFETESLCLEAFRPDYVTDEALQSAGAIDLAGSLAGTATLLARSEASCNGIGVQFPFAAYCLVDAGRFGILSPTLLGHDRLAGSARSGQPIRLSAYRRLATCPRLTTVLENETYCLVAPVW